MGRGKGYPQEIKDEIIARYRQSGMNQSRFCEQSEVPISDSTLSEWLRRAGYDRYGIPIAIKQEQIQPALNMVCYNVGVDARPISHEGNSQQPTLSQMVTFHQEVHDICIELYRLVCSKESITLLRRIKEVL